MLCFRTGDGFSTQALVSTGGAAATACRDEGGRALRCLPRGAARQASEGVFPSVARMPLPPGGEIYEGEKKEKEKREDSDFNRRVGKVISTLRQDYPIMFDEPLDFDIYTPDLQLRDPVSLSLMLLLLLLLLLLASSFFALLLLLPLLLTLVAGCYY